MKADKIKIYPITILFWPNHVTILQQAYDPSN